MAIAGDNYIVAATDNFGFEADQTITPLAKGGVNKIYPLVVPKAREGIIVHYGRDEIEIFDHYKGEKRFLQVGIVLNQFFDKLGDDDCGDPQPAVSTCSKLSSEAAEGSKDVSLHEKTAIDLVQKLVSCWVDDPNGSKDVPDDPSKVVKLVFFYLDSASGLPRGRRVRLNSTGCAWDDELPIALGDKRNDIFDRPHRQYCALFGAVDGIRRLVFGRDGYLDDWSRGSLESRISTLEGQKASLPHGVGASSIEEKIEVLKAAVAVQLKGDAVLEGVGGGRATVGDLMDALTLDIEHDSMRPACATFVARTLVRIEESLLEMPSTSIVGRAMTDERRPLFKIYAEQPRTGSAFQLAIIEAGTNPRFEINSAGDSGNCWEEWKSLSGPR